MKLSHYLIGLLLLLVFLSISIGTSDFSWGKLFALDHETWLLFQESRLPRTISILLAASSMKYGRTAHADYHSKSVCCTEYSWNH